MDLLNIFTLNLFIDILPDGILSLLSDKSKLINNMVYYDKNSTNKISHILNMKDANNMEEYLRIIQLQGYSQLEELYLRNKNIGNSGVIAIGNGLKGSQLKTLILSDNHIGNDGAKAIGNGLKGSQLEKLYLINTNIGNSGAIAIGNGLKDSRLRFLAINNNYIGDTGAKALAIGNELKELYLGMNHIGDKMTKYIKNLDLQKNIYINNQKNIHIDRYENIGLYQYEYIDIVPFL